MATETNLTILFDLDGTLTDSAPGIKNCVRFGYESLGLQAPSEEQLQDFIGPPLYLGARLAGLPGELIEDFIAAYRVRFAEVGWQENSVYPGILDLLTGLQASGYRLAVATSKPEVFARKIVAHFGMEHFFDFIGGATLDNTRSLKADVISYVLENLGNPEAAIMVGDREHDVLGAKIIGLDAIAVTWGYGSATEIAACEPKWVVNEATEVARILADLR